MNSKSVITSGMLALAFASACALAAQPEDPMAKNPQQPVSNPSQTMKSTSAASTTVAKGKFDMLDTNHDGYVDQQEAAASNALSAQFSQFDSNKDSKLSLTEFASIHDLASIKIDKKKKGYE